MSHFDASAPNPIDGVAALSAGENPANAFSRPAGSALPATMSDQQIVKAVIAALLNTRTAMVRDGKSVSSWIEVAQVLAGAEGDSSHNPLGQPGNRRRRR